MNDHALVRRDGGNGRGPVYECVDVPIPEFNAFIQVARCDGFPPKIVFSSAIAALGKDSFEKRLDGLYCQYGVVITVRSPEGVKAVKAVSKDEFYEFALLSHNPKCDPFRKKVVALLVEFEEKGFCVRPGATPPALPADCSPEEAQLVAIQTVIGTQIQVLRTQREQGQAIAAVRDDMTDLRKSAQVAIELVQSRPDVMTTRAFLVWKDRNLSKLVSEARSGKEGIKHLQRCKELGLLPGEYVRGHGDWPAREWPMEVLEEWYPGFREQILTELETNRRSQKRRP